MIKDIVVFTSIRSEYGLLKPLLDCIRKNKELNLKLLVGGAHLSNEHGYTKKEIINDGFEIASEFDFLKSEKEADYITQSMGELQIQIGKWLVKNKADLIIVLGDRFELIPVVSSALVLNIPVAHISGGDVTEGAIDNQVRNALTKMSHLHFPATEIYKQNILKMGEEEWRICVSGEPGLDQLNSMDYYYREDLFKELNLKPDVPVICATFHPETINDSISPDFIESLFEKINCETQYQILVTASNFDAGGEKINNKLEELSKSNSKIRFVKSLGQRRYYSLLKYSALMIGNSSSGIVEAQSFKLPVINVGDRQAGRLSNKNVIHIEANVEKILSAISVALSDEFKNSFVNEPNIYGKGNASVAILNFIKSFADKKKLLVKRSTF